MPWLSAGSTLLMEQRDANKKTLKTLSVGLEPEFSASAFCKQLELPVHMGQVFMGKIFHSCLIIFVCIRLDGIIMEKHKL